MVFLVSGLWVGGGRIGMPGGWVSRKLEFEEMALGAQAKLQGSTLGLMGVGVSKDCNLCQRQPANAANSPASPLPPTYPNCLSFTFLMDNAIVSQPYVCALCGAGIMS